MPKSRNNNPKLIQSIQRAFNIIDCFDNQARELSLNEISQKIGLNKSTVHGIINTLFINEYISQNPENGKYMLGKKLMIKGMLVSDALTLSLKEKGTKYLKEITHKFKITSHLFAWKNNSLYRLEMLFPDNSQYVISSMAEKETLLLHASASGKIVLAHLPEMELEKFLQSESLAAFTPNTITDINVLKKNLQLIKTNNYSIENEETEIGIYAVSVPIYGISKNLIGTISVLGQTAKLKNNIHEIIDCLKNASTKITEELF